MKVAVAGGAGFLGSLLCRHLADAGHEITIIDDLSNANRAETARLPGTLITHDVRDMVAITDRLQGVEVFYHLAAITNPFFCDDYPEQCRQINTGVVSTVLQFCESVGVKRFIFTSCGGLAGRRLNTHSEHSRPDNKFDRYTLSKLEAEAALREYSGAVSVCTARIFSVYGPEQDPYRESSGVVSKMMALAKAGQYTTVFGSGEAKRDFIYLQDAVAILAWLAGTKLEGPVDIGTGVATSINDLVQQIFRTLGREPMATYLPPRPGDLLSAVADVSQLQAAGAPQPISLAEGLKKFL